MGYLSLYGMLDVAGPDVAIGWHLSQNIYPPLEEGAREATMRVYERIKAGTYAPEERIEWRMANGEYQTISAGNVVRAVNLEAFIDWFAEHGGESQFTES